ncbi:MAG: tetratricopeptide repeat protein [Candidatus Marinimicrobia bacterium]|nr:tetratricopeptide repeat protein [Candidatus Neomarinimicrobiota bacterium]
MQKYIKLFWLLFTVYPFVISAQDNADFYFQKGNEYYMEENYPEAVRQYESVLNIGYESPELYFNLGNAYYKSGQLGKAILNYERALKKKPQDKNIQFNLKLANLRVKDRIEVPPEFFLFRWNRKIVQLLSTRNWAWFVAALFFLASVLTSIFVVGEINRFKRQLKIAAITLFFCAGLIMMPLIQRYQMEKSRAYGVVLSSHSKSLAAPQEGSTELFIVHEGTKVRILDTDGDWSKIELIDGKQGWILSLDLGII